MEIIFKINGQLFSTLDGQVHNSSAYNIGELETAWRVLEVICANTSEIPIYWELVAPENQIIEEFRKRDLKLILLWLGTWERRYE